MLAIYKRELKSYFHTFIGFLFIGVTLFFVGLFFSSYNVMNRYPYFSYAISSVILIFLVTIPILTMRSLSEERKNKTDQLILTAPVSVGKIVMGKYLALLTVFAIPTVIIATYPLLMARHGVIPMGEAYLSMAFFLYGMTCIAVGLFVSSMTESPVIAAVGSFGLLFLGYLMKGVTNMIPNKTVAKVIGFFDMYTPFARMLEGTLNLVSVAYYITLTGLFLFFTGQSIQKRRYSVSVKSIGFGVYSTGMLAAAIVITVLVNVILGELPTTWTSVDVTYEQVYSLTDQTKEFVKGLEEDIAIYVMANEENHDSVVAQTVKKYDDLSDHITVTYVDPNVNPKFHTQYTSNSISWGGLIVVGEKRSKVVSAYDLYENTYDYNTGANITTGYDGEGQITSALAYVTSEDISKIYILEGHGEKSISYSFKTALTKENVEYEEINLLNYQAVPEDTACLVINAPASDLSVDDLNKVLAYLEDGGKIVVNTGLTDADMSNFKKLFAYMGLELADGFLIEGDTNYYSQSQAYLLPEVSYSPYTGSIYGKYYIFAPYAQGIIVNEEENPDITYDQFVTTSDKAFSKVNINSSDYTKQEQDIEGPFAIGVEARKYVERGQAVMVAYSCMEMFTDAANQVVSGGNQMLFTNTISSFADHEMSVSVPPKSYNVSYLTIPESKALVLMVMTVVVLPLSSLIIGFVIWLMRRKR